MTVKSLVKSIQDTMRKDMGVDGDAQRIGQLCWMFFLKIIDDQDQELELLKEGYRSPVPNPLQWRNWAADPEGITGETLLTFVNDNLFPTLKALPVGGNPRARVVRSVFEDAFNYMKSGQLMRQVVNTINRVDFNNLAERQHFGDIYEQILNDLQSAGNAGEYYTPRAVTAFMTQMIDPNPGETLLDPACGTGGFLTCAMRHMRERYVKRPEDEARMQASFRAVEKKALPHMLAITNMLLHNVEDPSYLRHDNTLARPYISWGLDERVDIVLTNPPFGGKEEDGIESNFPQSFRSRETADMFLALIVRLLKPGGRAAVVLPDGLLFGEDVKTRIKEHLLEQCNLHTIVRLPNSVFSPYAKIGTNLLFFEKGEPTREIWFWEHIVPKGQKHYSMTKPIRLGHMADCAAWWGGPERKGREENPRAWKVSIAEIRNRTFNLDVENPHTVVEGYGNPETQKRDLGKYETESRGLSDQLKEVLNEALIRLNGGDLLACFNNLTAAPGAVAKLRQFVLELAVRGKLVEQDAREEPTSVLLNRVAAAKARLVEAGMLKRMPPLSPIDEPVFELPETWQWTRLGAIAAYIQRGKSPKYADTDGVPVVSQKCVQWDGLDLSVAKMITKESLEKYEPIRFLQNGDLLWNSTGTGTIGRVIRLVSPQDKLVCDSHVTVVRLLEADPEYIRTWLRTDHVYGIIENRATGATNQVELTAKMAREQPVPLPPREEQYRIVEKVDELMGLCDRLESSVVSASQTRLKLLESLLHEVFVSAEGTPVL